MATQTPNPYSFDTWEKLLAGKPVAIHEGVPCVGCYELRQRGERIPVIIYSALDERTPLMALAGPHEEAYAIDPVELWPQLHKRPITEDTYDLVASGEPWPDEAPPPEPSEAEIARSQSFIAAVLGPEEMAEIEREGAYFDQPPPAGHNAPPADDDHQRIMAEIEQIESQAAKLLDGTIDKRASNQLANLKDRVVALQKDADGAYKAELKPYDDEVKRIRDRWRGLRDRIPLLASRIRKGITAFLRAVEEAEAKKAAEAIKAGEAPEDAAPQPAQAGGAKGRKTALRTYYKAEITDYEALLAHIKEQPDIKAAVQKVADAAARNKITLPGMKIIEERRAT